MIRVTYYLDIVSSWCFYSESTWSLLKARYGNVATFDWRIATIPDEGLPRSREEEEWYYRRSGTMVGRSPMLHSGWWEPEVREYLAPNAVAEAGRDLGFAGDEIRLALARAALEDGQRVGQWAVSAAVAAPIAGLEAAELEAMAHSAKITDRIRAATAAFLDLKVSQRPTFVIEDEIGDRAVLSGLIQAEPLTTTIDQMIADCRAYRSWKAHFGNPG